MISPIPPLPCDVIKPIFLEGIDSLPVLKVFQEVSKGFKEVVDNPEFLHSLLVKFKGTHFSDPAYKSLPKKYFVLDQALTLAFRRIVEGALTISLIDLHSEVFLISGESKSYIKISSAQVEKLKKVDVDDQENWQQCIEDIVTDMSQVEALFQLELGFVSNMDFLQLIESTFMTPNEMMQKVITNYEITDVFFANEHLIINHRVEGLKFRKLQEAALGPDYAYAIQMAYEMLKEISVCSSDGESVKYLIDSSKQKALHVLLKTFKSNQLEAYFWSFDVTHRFLLGEVFSDIWPKVKEGIGDIIYNSALNYFLIKSFYKSIRCVEGLEYHVNLQKLMLNRLKDPSNGLKGYIETHCTPECLELFQNTIFPEIWH